LLELTENSNDTLDKETLSALNETTDKTYELLNNLLTWGSLNKGDFRPINSNIYLKESILKVLSTYKPQFDKKSLQLNVNLSEDNFIIYADANYIEIVFRNLISNAIKFTPKGGSISLDLFEYKVAKKVVVKIKDSGVGMQTSKLSSLFESVSQKSTQGTDNEQGTGLGLVLVKEILDAMKADVQVESELNEGTTFTLKFDRI
jgi:signal transduction histidine kinase